LSDDVAIAKWRIRNTVNWGRNFIFDQLDLKFLNLFSANFDARPVDKKDNYASGDDMNE